MNPIPLTDPQGRVWAYLCGSCHHIRGLAEVMYDVVEPVESIVQMSLEQAERCCTCRLCGAQSSWHRPSRTYAQLCEACEAKAKEDEPRRIAEIRYIREKEDALLEAGLAKAIDRDAAIRLRDVMSEASEEVMCAGWLIGLEYALDEALRHPLDAGEWTPYIPELRRLSEKAGGWWRWVTLPSFEDGTFGGSTEVFLTHEEWKAHLEEREAERAGFLDEDDVRQSLLDLISDVVGDTPPVDFEKVSENLEREVDRVVGSLTPAEKAILEKRFPGERWDSSGGYEVVPKPEVGSPTWCAATAWCKDTCINPQGMIRMSVNIESTESAMGTVTFGDDKNDKP